MPAWEAVVNAKWYCMQDPRPALGESWRGQPSARLLLTHAGPAGQRQAVLVASGRRRTPQAAYYSLSEGMNEHAPAVQQDPAML